MKQGTVRTVENVKGSQGRDTKRGALIFQERPVVV